LGTCSNLSAPVDETITFSSISIPGNDTGTEPVAIIVFSVCIIVSLLLLSLITISFLDLKLPVPLKYVTLFFVNKF